MKTLQSIVFSLVLIVICSAAKANSFTKDDKLTTTHAINSYVDAMTRGKLTGFKDVLDASVKFNMLRGNKVLSFGKNEMMDFMKTNQNVKQACTINTTVIENNADVTVIKVDMNFNSFIRSDYVSIANIGNGWKITNVYSVFK